MHHQASLPGAVDPDDMDHMSDEDDTDSDSPWPLVTAVDQRDLPALRQALPQALPQASEVVREMALLSCTTKGFTQGAALLLEACVRKDRRTALYQAASAGHAQIVRLLLNHVPGRSDHSEALASAVARKHHAVIPVLLPYANPDEAARNLLDDDMPEVDLLAAHLSEATLRHALDILDGDQLPAIAARLASIEQGRALEQSASPTLASPKSKRL